MNTPRMVVISALYLTLRRFIKHFGRFADFFFEILRSQLVFTFFRQKNI